MLENSEFTEELHKCLHVIAQPHTSSCDKKEPNKVLLFRNVRRNFSELGEDFTSLGARR